MLNHRGSGSGSEEVITDMDPEHWIVPSLFCLVVFIWNLPVLKSFSIIKFFYIYTEFFSNNFWQISIIWKHWSQMCHKKVKKLKTSFVNVYEINFVSFPFFKKGKAIEPQRQNILHLAVSFVGQFYGFPNIETALL